MLARLAGIPGRGAKAFGNSHAPPSLMMRPVVTQTGSAWQADEKGGLVKKFRFLDSEVSKAAQLASLGGQGLDLLKSCRNPGFDPVGSSPLASCLSSQQIDLALFNAPDEASVEL